MARRKTCVKLRPVVNDLPRGEGGWCGPSVVSAITGQPLSVVKATIKLNRVADPADREVRRKLANREATKRYAFEGLRAVKGTSCADLIRAFGQFGYRMVSVCDPWPAPTLARWLRDRSPEERRQVHVLVVGNHWIAVSGRKMVDSFTKIPTWLGKAPHRRKRVTGVFRIYPS